MRYIQIIPTSDKAIEYAGMAKQLAVSLDNQFSDPNASYRKIRSIDKAIFDIRLLPNSVRIYILVDSYLFITTPHTSDVDYPIRSTNKGVISNEYGTYDYSVDDLIAGNQYYLTSDNEILSWWGEPGGLLHGDSEFQNIRIEDPQTDNSIKTTYTSYKQQLFYNGDVEWDVTREDTIPDIILGAGYFRNKVVLVCRRRDTLASPYRLVVLIQGIQLPILDVITPRIDSTFWFNIDSTEAVCYYEGIKYKLTLSSISGVMSATLMSSQVEINNDVLVTSNGNEQTENLSYQLGTTPTVVSTLNPSVRSQYETQKNYTKSLLQENTTTVSDKVITEFLGNAFKDILPVNTTLELELKSIQSIRNVIHKNKYFEVPIVGDRTISINENTITEPIVAGQQITASASGNLPVSWSMTNGTFTTINDSTIEVVSSCHPNIITAIIAGAPCIADSYATTTGSGTPSLPAMISGVANGASVAATGGTPPYTYSISSGAATINASTGQVTYTSCTSGNFGGITVRVIDACGLEATREYHRTGGTGFVPTSVSTNCIAVSATPTTIYDYIVVDGISYDNDGSGNYGGRTISQWFSYSSDPRIYKYLATGNFQRRGRALANKCTNTLGVGNCPACEPLIPDNCDNFFNALPSTPRGLGANFLQGHTVGQYDGCTTGQAFVVGGSPPECAGFTYYCFYTSFYWVVVNCFRTDTTYTYNC